MSVKQAEANLKTVARQLEQEYPNENKGRNVALIPLAQSTINPGFRSNIVMAGDSLARRSAALEAAARRAAVDSAARLLRDSLGRDTTAVGQQATPAPDSAAVAAAAAAAAARARVRRDSAAARARRDSVGRAQAAADSLRRQIPGAPPITPPATVPPARLR